MTNRMPNHELLPDACLFVRRELQAIRLHQDYIDDVLELLSKHQFDVLFVHNPHKGASFGCKHGKFIIHAKWGDVLLLIPQTRQLTVITEQAAEVLFDQ